MNRAIRTVIGVLLASLTLIVCVIALRPSMDEVGIPLAVPVDNDYTGLRVRWLGVSTLLIDDGETQILTDGFISRPSALDLLLQRPIESDIAAVERAIKTHQLDRLAAVIPLHSHYDHAIDSAHIAKITGADVVGSTSTANIAASSGLAAEQTKIAPLLKPIVYGAFSLTFIESRHAPLPTNEGIEGVVEEPFSLPAPYTAWQEGGSYSLHIAHPEGNVLVQGSAGFISGKLDDFRADTVFLGTGGLNNLGSQYASDYSSETVHAVKAQRVISIHHDNLFGAFGDVEQSKLMPSFDQSFAFELTQLILPARLELLPFGVDTPIQSAENKK